MRGHAQTLSAQYAIPYQTTLRTVQAGVATPYVGDAYFKFVLFRQASAGAPRVPIWSHDPDYLGGLDPARVEEVPEPLRMVRVGVPDGVASLLLGGTEGVMLEPGGTPSTANGGGGQPVPLLMSPLDPSAFSGGTLRLRVWVGKATNSFERLEPDLPLAASPLALRAAVADAVVPGGVTAEALSADLGDLLGSMAALSERGDDPRLGSLGLVPVRQFPAAPYQRLGTGTPPTGRVNHAAVLTGTELLVFGGAALLNGDPMAGGVRFNLASGTWNLLPTSGAPLARHGAVSVWTGSRWIVWGGAGTSGLLADGASFDPAANRWTALSAVPAGAASRQGQAWAWTGTHVLIWGGRSSGGLLSDGLAYDAVAGTWKRLPAFPGAARYLHSAVWTGTTLVVWGGQGEEGPLSDGYEFDPGADPAQGTWKAIPASPLGPRHSHTALWTPVGMVLWGGVQGAQSLGDGAVWWPPSGVWRLLPDAQGFLPPASRVAGVVTTAGLYLFGGATASGATASAAYLDLNRLTWHAAPPPGPAARFGHTVAGTASGNEILIFGGADPAVAGAFNDVWRLPAERMQYLYRKP